MKTITRKESNRRIKVLAKYLKNLKRRQIFDFGMWGFKFTGKYKGRYDSHYDPAVKDCGTVACAAGHATQIPEFQKLGLSAMSDRDFCPQFEDSNYAVDAMAKFLGISYDESSSLFVGAIGVLTAKNFARRLNQFVKERES